MTDTTPSNSPSFWKKLTSGQKLSLFIIAAFAVTLPVGLLASQQKTRTAPKASEPQPTLTLKKVTPTKQIQPTPNKNRIPKKPSNIIVECATDGKILISGEVTTCLKPTFKWSSDAAGFFIYYGPKPINQINLYKDGKFWKEKTFTSANTKPGQKYNFFVQEAKADGSEVLWLPANDVDPLTWKKPDFVLVTQ